MPITIDIRYLKYFYFTSFLLVLLSIAPYTYVPLGNTYIWWGVTVFIYFITYINYQSNILQIDSESSRHIKNYLYWMLFSLAYGVIEVRSYWDLKFLVGNTFSVFVPIVIFPILLPHVFAKFIQSYFKFTLPLFIVLQLLFAPTVYGSYLIFTTVLLPFFWAMNLRTKIILGLCLVVAVFGDLSNRSILIKFSVAFIISFAFFFQGVLSNRLLGNIRRLFFLIPFFLLTLALSNIFNIFNLEQYIKDDYVEVKLNAKGEIEEESLVADTRTFIYEEVISSAVNNGYWLIGRSLARGNDSVAFDSYDITGRHERNFNEVGILNVFTWAGLIGVFFYTMLFWHSSKLAIFASKNIYIKVIGVFVAFRWLYSWAEDINLVTLDYFTLMCFIAMCFSPFFRQMTNEEIEKWFQKAVL